MAFSSPRLVLFSLALFTSIAAPVTLGLQLPKPTPSQLLFLERLHGCRKGDNVEGIHNLKIYLQRYGYLSNGQTQSQGVGNNVFDDPLESAIKVYQENFHLNVTGILDAETLIQMSRPRCGVADFFNGTNRKNPHDHGRDHGHFHTGSHYAFFPEGFKWPSSKRHLTYTFIHNYPSKFMAPVSRAFSHWASVSQFTFSQNPNGAPSDIKISFERGNHGDGSPFDGRGGVLAHAFAPTDGRLHLDVDETWVAGAVFDAFDVESVALHELGHVLGLAHTTVKDAIMFPTIDPGATKGLSRDDIAGIRALYR